MGGIELSAGDNGAMDSQSSARFRSLTGPFRVIFLLCSTIGVLLAAHQILGLQSLTGLTLLENSYLYLLVALYLSNVFLIFPAIVSIKFTHLP